MRNSSISGIDVVVDSWAVNLEKDLKILSDWGKLLFVDLHGPKGGNLYLTALMSKQARVQGKSILVIEFVHFVFFS